MDRYGRAATAALLTVLAACGTQAPSQDQPDASPVGASPAATLPALATDIDRIRDHLAAFHAIAGEHGGVRVVGSAGYDASVEYAAAKLRDIGFEVTTPEVGYTGFREHPGGLLEVGERTFHAPDDLHALIYSPSGDVRGRVTVLTESGCDPDHLDGVEAGAVVLTVQGGCLRRQQAVNAADAGASALLIGYPGRGAGEIFRPTLIDPGGLTIPVASVTDEAIGALEAAGGEPVHLVVRTEREPATLRNVIAQLGSGPAVIMIGGHLDSVFEGPGINDNGSGVAALLEIAQGMVTQGSPDGVAVRIGLWGGEELGTIGSRAYVDGLGDEVIAYLNLDMAGSLNGASLVYDEADAAAGSAAITAAYEAWFAERGEPTETVDLGGSSDHFGFIAAGIPTGGLFAGATESGSAAQPGTGGSGGEPADACYHLACDDLDNVDVERVALFAQATFAVTYALAADR